MNLMQTIKNKFWIIGLILLAVTIYGAMAVDYIEDFNYLPSSSGYLPFCEDNTEYYYKGYPSLNGISACITPAPAYGNATITDGGGDTYIWVNSHTDNGGYSNAYNIKFYESNTYDDIGVFTPDTTFTFKCAYSQMDNIAVHLYTDAGVHSFWIDAIAGECGSSEIMGSNCKPTIPLSFNTFSFNVQNITDEPLCGFDLNGETLEKITLTVLGYDEQVYVAGQGYLAKTVFDYFYIEGLDPVPDKPVQFYEDFEDPFLFNNLNLPTDLSYNRWTDTAGLPVYYQGMNQTYSAYEYNTGGTWELSTVTNPLDGSDALNLRMTDHIGGQTGYLLDTTGGGNLGVVNLDTEISFDCQADAIIGNTHYLQLRTNETTLDISLNNEFTNCHIQELSGSMCGGWDTKSFNLNDVTIQCAGINLDGEMLESINIKTESSVDNYDLAIDNLYIGEPQTETCVVPTSNMVISEHTTFCSGTYYVENITVGNNLELYLVGTILSPEGSTDNAMITMGTGSGLYCDETSQFLNIVDSASKDAVVFNDWGYMWSCDFYNFDNPDSAMKVFADFFGQFYYNNFQNSVVYPITGNTYWFQNIFTKPINFNTPSNEFHHIVENQILAGYQIEGYGGFNITGNVFANNDFEILTGINMGSSGAYFYNNTIDGVNLYESNPYYDDVVYCVDGVGNNFINGGAYTGSQTTGGTCPPPWVTPEITNYYVHTITNDSAKIYVEFTGTDTRVQLQLYDEFGTPIMANGQNYVTNSYEWTLTPQFLDPDSFYTYDISLEEPPSGTPVYDSVEGNFTTLPNEQVVCTENWVIDVEQCTISDLLYREYIDTNACGTTDDRPADHMNPTEACNYCTVQYSYTQTDCIENQKNITYNLENGAECCDLTLIPEDCDIPEDMIGVECGFVPQHNTDQITGLVIDTSVEIGRTWIPFASVIAILGLAGWIMFLL